MTRKFSKRHMGAWTPQIHVVVAVGRDWSIGKDNALMWNLPSDLEMFKRITMNETLLMGRNTALSIGSALPGRKCLVLTQQIEPVVDDMINVSEVRLAMVVARQRMSNLICIGGARLYDELIPQAEVLHLTTVDGEFPDADTHISPIDMTQWKVDDEWERPADVDHSHGYGYRRLIRR